MKKTPLKKQSKRTIAKIKKDLDILWSKFIRNRDGICQKCGKTKASQAAHIFSRKNLSVRWHPKNGIGMCYFCHIIWSHREPVEFTEWVKLRMGSKYEDLRKLSREIYSETNLKNPAEIDKLTRELKYTVIK